MCMQALVTNSAYLVGCMLEVTTCTVTVCKIKIPHKGCYFTNGNIVMKTKILAKSGLQEWTSCLTAPLMFGAAPSKPGLSRDHACVVLFLLR